MRRAPAALALPLWLRRAITGAVVRLALGSPQDYGLPEPDHELFETHPIINSQMLYYVGHGRIAVKPDVAELCGDAGALRRRQPGTRST